MYPNLEGKHEHDPLVTPKRYFEYAKERGDYPKKKIPNTVVICFHKTLLDYVKENYNVEKIDFEEDFYRINNSDMGIIGNFGIGAPTTAIIIEELAELGVKNIISLGLAGSLDEDLEMGKAVICNRAIRDEGTTYHYTQGSRYAEPTKDYNEKIKDIFREEGMDFIEGLTWTIDAPYRETLEEVQMYKEEGVKTVEMEASAIFVVGKFRGLEVASIFVVSDHLTETDWKPQFKEAEEKMGSIFDILFRNLK
ncbi:MAG: nucleoside phosphorylase [Candidatus Aenigmatarchaeota archaeon]